MRTFAITVAFTIAASAVGVARADDAPIPIETFFRNADIGAAKLSPSGRWLALTTATRTSRTFLAVVDTSGPALDPKVVANFNDADVNSFDWVNDDRLVYNTIDTQSPLNDQRFGPGLYSVKRDGSEPRMLVRPRWDVFVERTSGMLTEPLSPAHQLLQTIDDGSEDVLVGEYKFTPGGEIDWLNPKRLNTATGRAISVARGAPEHAFGWVFDRAGNPRALETIGRGQHEVFWKKDENWVPVSKSSAIAPAFHPLAVDGEGHLYVSAGSGGFASLKRFDFATGKPEGDAMVSAKGFDLGLRLRMAPASAQLLGVGFETDAGSTVWFDADYKKLQEMVDARYPGHVNVIQCGGDCRTSPTMLVSSYSDQDPGAFFLYHLADKTWDSIGRSRSGIDPKKMAQLDFFRTKARDGEDLPIWVTMPQGKSDKPRAAVVLVHGGPWVRGVRWRWDADAQFLASRGYVVLEPEFRGSTGYGSAHFRKGFKQWGTTMQDDLIDTVQWAAAKGIVDPKRVCIAGASYGGYATLMSLSRYPDAYRCGVAWVAVSDPRLLFSTSWSSDVSAEARLFSLPVMVGDPVADAAMLKDAAPVEHAAEMRAPLLMAFGANDRRVPLEHGEKMRDAMRRANLQPEYVVYDGEGHGFLKLSNRVDFWTRVEKFLAKNLGQER